MSDLSPVERLLQIMQQLRDPCAGCPWDREQTHTSIAHYTLEEAYEVNQAIMDNDMQALKQELGDLLLQVVFHAQIAEESGAFDFDDIAHAIGKKMIARHPHVFAGDSVDGAQAQQQSWENIKAQERAAKNIGGLLDDIPLAFPALLRAQKLQKRAARVGFDWPDVTHVYAKIDEEIAEIKEAAAHKDSAHIEEEIGDTLFVLVNLARHYHIDAETALRRANSKFEQRFSYIETRLATTGRTAEEANLQEMDALWEEAKRKKARN